MESKTEDNILLAAEQEFLNKGYMRTTMADIANKASVNHALLHYYYRNKENLFIKVFEKNIKNITTLMYSLIDNSVPFLERVQKFIEIHFDYIAQNPKLPFFIVNEILANKICVAILQKQLQPIVNEITKQLDKEIRKEYELGHINYITVENLIYEIISLNICSFVLMPVSTQLLNVTEKEYLQFVEQRRTENVVTILNRLTKTI